MPHTTNGGHPMPHKKMSQILHATHIPPARHTTFHTTLATLTIFTTQETYTSCQTPHGTHPIYYSHHKPCIPPANHTTWYTNYRPNTTCHTYNLPYWPLATQTTCHTPHAQHMSHKPHSQHIACHIHTCHTTNHMQKTPHETHNTCHVPHVMSVVCSV